MESAISEVEDITGLSLHLVKRLEGGEQGGAQLLAAGNGDQLVLKLQPDADKGTRLIKAAPVIRRAVRAGWPAADWLEWGTLRDGSAFVLQQYVEGSPVREVDAATLASVLTANACQKGLGYDGAADDSGQLEAVTTGRHPWRKTVGDHSAQGRALVERGSALLAELGPITLPTGDLTHGDYSTTNMLRTRDERLIFIDSETVGRGTRIRDLADLYRQLIVYPGTPDDLLDTLRQTAVEIAGAAVFATCLIAVSYNNLAWWAEHQPLPDFDLACERLCGAFGSALTGE